MKMNISRDPAIAESPDAIVQMNLSLQVGKELAITLQTLGVMSIRLMRQDTVASSRLVYAESMFFEDVPSEIVKWADPSLPRIADYMGSFGILEISLSPSDKDMDSLRRTWEYIVNDVSQVKSDPDMARAVERQVQKNLATKCGGGDCRVVKNPVPVISSTREILGGRDDGDDGDDGVEGIEDVEDVETANGTNGIGGAGSVPLGRPPRNGGVKPYFLEEITL